MIMQMKITRTILFTTMMTMIFLNMPMNRTSS